MATIKKDGSTWYYLVDLGKDENGKRRQKKKRGFKTKKEATEAMNLFLAELNSKEYVPENKTLFKHFLKTWLDGKKASLRPSTYIRYQHSMDTYIIPRLGNIEVQKLTPIKLQDFINDLIKEGLAAGSIIKIHTVINGTLEKAVAWGIASKNVAKLVELPKTQRKEMKTWNVEQVRAFLKEIETSRYYIAFLLALTTGMRQGEILGLRWKDVNLDEGVIYVTQTFNQDTREFYNNTKTDAGRRLINIDEFTVNELRRQKGVIEFDKEFARDKYEDNDLVTCSKLGRPFYSTHLTRFLKETCEKLKLPDIRFHDLRHTHASLLLLKGTHPKIVSERLGHSNISITLDVYSHVLPSLQKETAQEFGNMLFKDVTNKN